MTRARDVANLIGSGNYSSTTFTATAGQTVFSIAHTQNFVQVFMNGLLLDLTVDYTSNGSAVTLTSGAAAGDEIEVVAYNTFSVGDALNQAAADTRYVNTAGDTMTGNLGIGAAPTRALHVDHATDATMIVNAAAGNQATYLLGEAGASKFNMSHKASDDTFQIYNYYNSGISLKIDSAGRVTIPNQPAFCAQGSPSVTNSVIHSYGSELFNTGSHYNNSTGKFTAPVGGKYFFTCSIWPSGTMDANNTYLAFYQNDSTERTGSHGATNRQEITISSVLSMSANDTMLVKILGGWSRQGSFPRNNFSGFLVG